MTVELTTPAEQGVDAGGIAGFVDGVERDGAIEPHGLVIQRHGHRIAEGYWSPHTAGRRRLVYSLSKTFTGTALALQLGEGRLRLDDLVADHLPELFGDAAPITRRLRIRHIASMSTGHDHEMLAEAVAADPADPLRAFFQMPPAHEPGTWFAYSQPPVLALARILERLAGQRLSDYLRPRIVEPLEMSPILWQQVSPGHDLGFSGVHTTLDDVARLGQLYLDDGRWEGRQILPDGWVAAASRVQVANPLEPHPDWQQGYGFQLWMARHGYRGDGAWGQFMIVLPEHDAVIAFFGATEAMQAVLDLVWTHLLPALGSTSRSPGSEDEELAERLAALALPTVRHRTAGAAPDAADGGFQPSAAALAVGLTAVTLRAGTALVETRDGSLTFPLTDAWTTLEEPFAVGAATREHRVLLDIAALETPHRLEVVCDRETRTFDAHWATQPLAFTEAGAGLLAQRAPTP